MARFHVLASLPRSGSTLFCNVLNQNPNFYASDTSPLSVGFYSYVSALTHRPEFTSELGNSQEEALSRLKGSARGLIEGYYAHRPESVIFDKDRSNSWLYQADSLQDVMPESKIICMVRDPREVIASALSHQAKLPLFREGNNPAMRTLAARASALISPQGLVGAAIVAITDAIMRSRVSNPVGDNILIIKFEEFAADPDRVMKAVYQAIEQEPFEHNFNNVVNVSKDQDFIYRNLWPHEGSGAIAPRKPNWPNVLPPSLAKGILEQHPIFCQSLGYS